jgi:IS5 family transposase
MVRVWYFKPAYNLVDEATCERWLESCYWQYFNGEVCFQTRLPRDPSLFTRCRNRLGGAWFEEPLAQTVAAA